MAPTIPGDDANRLAAAPPVAAGRKLLDRFVGGGWKTGLRWRARRSAPGGVR